MAKYQQVFISPKMCAFISSDVELTNPYFIYIVKPLIHKTKQAADATSLINFRGRGLTD